jgi:hypothetical protein
MYSDLSWKTRPRWGSIKKSKGKVASKKSNIPNTVYNDQYTRPNKDRVNKRICDLSKPVLNNVKRVLCLDHTNLLSSNCFNKAFNCRVDVYEAEEKVVDAMIETNDNDLINIVNDDVFNVSKSEAKYNIVYLDFCATLRISLIYVNEALKCCDDECVLAVTESLRDPVRDMNRAGRDLLSMVNRFGFDCKFCKEEPYHNAWEDGSGKSGGNMKTTILHLKRTV